MSYLPTVSLTFDGPYDTISTNALTAMNANGLIGTAFCCTLSPFMGTAPFANSTQVATLAAAGWEIGVYSGTISTRNMVDALTYSGESAVLTQLQNAKAGVEALGYSPTSLAPNQRAWGDYRLRNMAGRIGFNSVRAAGAGSSAKQQYPVADKLYVYGSGCDSLTNTDTSGIVTGYIDSLISQGGWLVIVIHGVANGGDVYHVPTTVFTALCEYIKAKQDLGLLRCVTFTEGLTPSGTPPAVPPMDNPTNTVGKPSWNDLLT